MLRGAVPLLLLLLRSAVVSMQITITKTIENAAKYFLQLVLLHRPAQGQSHTDGSENISFLIPLMVAGQLSQ